MIKRFKTEKALIDVGIFKKLVIQTGIIKTVTPLQKAKKPSYEMNGSFGANGNKKSCGQFVRNYKQEELMNKQILALTNLSPVKIAGVKSEYLTLGFPDDADDGQAISLTPCIPVEEGVRVVVDNQQDYGTETVAYEIFDSLEVRSATIIDIITSKSSKKYYCVVDFGENVYDLAFVPGKLSGNVKNYLNIQIPVITNLNVTNNSDELDDVKLVALAVPINKDGNVTLIKIDKKVRNNLIMF